MGKLFFCYRHYSYFWVSLDKVALCLLPNHGEIVRFSTDEGSCESPVMTADNEMNLQWVAESPDPIAGTPQFQKNSYARELRAVGQALEAQHVFSLDLELKGGFYVIRGKVTAADYAQSSFSGFI